MPASKRLAGGHEANDSSHRLGVSQQRLAFAGMNPDFFSDGCADFCFDAFDEAHADAAEFVGGPDRGGNFQRGLLYLTSAKVRSRVDAFECIRHFYSFHNLLSWLRR